MKLLILGDTHFRYSNPEKRIDNYWETQLRKLHEVLSIFEAYDCDHIIQVGDFFDSPNVSNYVVSSLIRRFKAWGSKIFCIYGQHDIFGHAAETYKRSPLAILEAAGCIELLDGNGSSLVSEKDQQVAMIYGASFGQEDPDTKRGNNFYNILVVHDMIGNKPLFPGQDLIKPRIYLEKHKQFDLICCGDYHYRFSFCANGRIICNPGAMMRKTVSEYDLAHRPGVFIVNTINHTVELVTLESVEPVSKVFDLESKTGTDNAKLMEFIDNLKGDNESITSWQHILQNVYREKGTPTEVRELVSESLEEIRTHG